MPNLGSINDVSAKPESTRNGEYRVSVDRLSVTFCKETPAREAGK